MKTWETPKLIVLVRNNPQEAVLDTCKVAANMLIAGDAGPATINTSCRDVLGGASFDPCIDCYGASFS